MRIGIIWNIPLKLNPLTFPMILLAMALGSGQELAILGVSLLLHEMGHAMCARLLRVRVIELELMPVGGAVRLENVWRLRPGQLIGVAFAGPLVNLLIMLACLSLPEGVWTPTAAHTIQLNRTLFLFNMFPALPLDGGRVLCGLLGRRMSPARAVRIGVRIGTGMACALLALAAINLRYGPLNLTPLLAALFMVCSAPAELRNASSAVILSLLERRDELAREKVMPVRVLAVSPDADAGCVLSALRPDMVHVFLCVNENGQTLVSEETMWQALMDGGTANRAADTARQKGQGRGRMPEII